MIDHFGTILIVLPVLKTHFGIHQKKKEHNLIATYDKRLLHKNFYFNSHCDFVSIHKYLAEKSYKSTQHILHRLINNSPQKSLTNTANKNTFERLCMCIYNSTYIVAFSGFALIFRFKNLKNKNILLITTLLRTT